ncbi:MAG TPA: CvpA family protein [Clostridiales bacterium]|nr:CvpA family protein [Clostridiales bacterium]
MNIVLLIVLAIIIINAYIGRRLGLVKILFSMLSMVIAIALTMWISPKIDKVLLNNDKVYEKVINGVEKSFEEKDKNEAKDQDEYINKLPIPESLRKSIKENELVEKQTEKITNQFKQNVYGYMAKVVIKAIAFLITFMTVFIMLRVLSLALNVISKLPIINALNQSGGLLVGLVQGVIIVWILFIVITASSSTELGKMALDSIKSSKILSFIYDTNFIFDIIISTMM